jgi:hypothetical protein
MDADLDARAYRSRLGAEPADTPQAQRAEEPSDTEPTRHVGRRVPLWWAGGAVLLLALLGVAIVFGRGALGTAQHAVTPSATATATATPAPTATATPDAVELAQQVVRVVARFETDFLQDDGADAYTLLTPQEQAQITPQQMTDNFKAPPDIVYVSFVVDPASVTVTGTSATVRATLTEIDTRANNQNHIVYEFHLDQQPDGSWRLASSQVVSS